jgi:hypothetical protein
MASGDCKCPEYLRAFTAPLVTRILALRSFKRFTPRGTAHIPMIISKVF